MTTRKKYPIEFKLDEDDIDLNSIELSHYRLSVIRQQDLKLKEDSADYQLEPGDGDGGAKPKDKQEEFLSQVVERLNELFITVELMEADLVSYVHTISDKVRENGLVMKQIANNTAEQVLLGDFNKAVDEAIMDSGEAHNNQMM
jgi:type I restriction enzyme R subunit